MALGADNGDWLSSMTPPSAALRAMTGSCWRQTFASAVFNCRASGPATAIELRLTASNAYRQLRKILILVRVNIKYSSD